MKSVNEFKLVLAEILDANRGKSWYELPALDKQEIFICYCECHKLDLDVSLYADDLFLFMRNRISKEKLMTRIVESNDNVPFDLYTTGVEELNNCNCPIDAAASSIAQHIGL